MSKKHPHMGDSNTGNETEHVNAHGFGMSGDAVVNGLSAEPAPKRPVYAVVARREAALRVAKMAIRKIEESGADYSQVISAISEHFREKETDHLRDQLAKMAYDSRPQMAYEGSQTAGPMNAKG